MQPSYFYSPSLEFIQSTKRLWLRFPCSLPLASTWTQCWCRQLSGEASLYLVLPSWLNPVCQSLWSKWFDHESETDSFYSCQSCLNAFAASDSCLNLSSQVSFETPQLFSWSRYLSRGSIWIAFQIFPNSSHLSCAPALESVQAALSTTASSFWLDSVLLICPDPTRHILAWVIEAWSQPAGWVGLSYSD